jgi:prepilin-type processing-associated H-X9-DG protein
MRTTLLLSLCCLIVAAAALPACAQDEESAARTVQQFTKALTSGKLERAASLMTPISVILMSSATSIVPPASMTEKPRPAFFDQQLTDSEAQQLRAVFDAMILADAVRIQPGRPVTTAQGVKVPVTITLKRDLFVAKEGDAILVDLAAPYPEARATLEGMTAEGEQAMPEGMPGEQQPGATPPAPGATPGAARESPSSAPPAGSGIGAIPAATIPAGAAAAPTPQEETARRATCLSNLKQLALALLMFAQDNNEQLPTAASWMNSIEPYVRDLKASIHCPSDAKHQYSYAMNSAVAGKQIGEFDNPVITVLLFESNSGALNAADPLTSLCDPPRHGNGNNFAYLDGHVKFVAKQ